VSRDRGSLARVNPLQRVRDGAGRAWFRSKRGTVRTADWVKDGVIGSFRKARSGVSGLRGGGEDHAPAQSAAAGRDDEGGPGVWERIGAASMVERVRSNQRLAIVAAVGGILLLAWTGWTIHVWTENGSTAGLGVLISWPAVFIAAAIVASPFVGAGVLVHRHRLAADGAPAIEGGGATATKDEQATEKSDGDDEVEADDSDDPKDSAGDDDDSEDDDADASDGDEDEDSKQEDSDDESEDAA
jgi:hypothetical protein